MMISSLGCEHGENSLTAHPAKHLHFTSMIASSSLVRCLEHGRPVRGFTSLVIHCQLPARIYVKLCMAIWESSHPNGIPLCRQRKTKGFTVMPAILCMATLSAWCSSHLEAPVRRRPFRKSCHR